MSGVLKNALDLLDSDHLQGKVVGAISVLAGPANSNALNELGRIMRSCHAWVLPQQIAIGRARTIFANGQIADTELERRFDRFAESLVWSASRIGDFETTARKNPSALINPANIQTQQLAAAHQTLLLSEAGSSMRISSQKRINL